MGRGLRVGTVLARPAEPRLDHTTRQAEGFEHPPIEVGHHSGAAPAPFPRIGDEPSDDPALFRGRIHLQRKSGGALEAIVRSSSRPVLYSFDFVIRFAQAFVHTTERPGDSEAISRPKCVNVEKSGRVVTTEVLDNLVSNHVRALFSNRRGVVG